MKPVQNTSELRKLGQNQLLDALIQQGGLKNDAALCRRLDVSAPLLSKIRHGLLGVSGAMLLRIHEEFTIPFSEIRQLMVVHQPADKVNFKLVPPGRGRKSVKHGVAGLSPHFVLKPARHVR